MKKNYTYITPIVFVSLLLFGIHLNSYSQTRAQSTNAGKQSLEKNISNIYERGAIAPAEIVTSCGPYTWLVTGQTYNTSGIYTSNGITQGYNNQTAWSNNVNAFNTTIASNSLGGLTATNPINLTVGSTAVSIGASPGTTYTTSTFVSTGTATSTLTINLSPGIYGFGANIFATDSGDVPITGDITVTYSTGFVQTRTVSSASEFFGYTSTTPITSVTITCANTVAPFKWPTINNLALATGANASLDLTVQTAPVTGNFTVCQGTAVSGGLTSNLGGGTPPVPLPNFTGNTLGGPTFNRPQEMNQGGTCLNSGVGTAVPYREHTFTAPTNGDYTFSNCGASSFDSFIALYQAPFNPNGLCAGNTLIESSDDFCGAQSTVTATLVGGTSYTLVVTGYGNTDTGGYTVTSTTPTTPVPGVQWYTSPTGGTLLGTGSPFNPVGVAGSGLTNTNTPGTTPFYAQFPGETCRTLANFIVTPLITPTFTTVAPICIGNSLTALPTTSINGITGTWSPALNPTATTTYTFTPNAGQCATTATMTITVNGLPTITCPANIITCEGNTVNFTVTSSISSGPVTLTQNTSSVAAANVGIGCNPGGDNAFYRVYDLTALGYTNNLTLNTIKFSVQSSAVDRIVTVSAYTLTGALTNENLTLLGSTTVTATTSTSIIDYAVAMGGLNVPSGSTLVISYAVAASTNNAFLPGANAAGQSAPVYIKAAACGIPQPTSLAGIGFPNVHVILDAELTQSGTLVQTAGLPSGSIFPVGTTTVTYLATNSSGCNASCSFNVTVNPSAATPTGSSTQTFPVLNTNDATVANLIVSPTNVTWYASLANAQAGINALPTSTVLTNGATYYAVNTSGTCPSTPFGVTVTVTLGNDDFDSLNFTYYPNPTSSTLNISYSKVITEIQVTNILGQAILTKKTNETEVQVDLSPFSEATYFVKVTSEDKSKIVKVIKKN